MEYKSILTNRSFFSTFIKLTTFCLFIMMLCIGGNCNRELKFTKVQDISPDFNNINDWEFFTINGNYYLAADRLWNGGGKELWAEGSPGVLCSEGSEAYYDGDKPSIIYQYDFISHNFNEIQSIRSEGFYCGEFFTIGNEFYLVGGGVPIFRGAARVSSPNESIIYRWDNDLRQFVDPEPIPGTTNVVDWEFFSIDGEYYLAGARRSLDLLPISGILDDTSIIYWWDGNRFRFFHSIESREANNLESFTINGNHYLAVVNDRPGRHEESNSDIFKWNRTMGTFYPRPEQSIVTYDAQDCEFFTIDEEHFLCVANGTADSVIYKWNGTIFDFFHTIPMHADDIDFLPNIAGSQLNGWLVVANKNYSKIYEWRKAESPFLIEFQEIPASKDRRFEHYGTRECEVFTIGNTHYIASANLGAESKIYAKKIH